MPRTARAPSASGIYHAMARGVNRQRIFTCDGDKERYLDCLWTSSEARDVSVHAYCLMENHVHLLIRQDGEFPIGEFFRSLGTRYAGWFNVTYGRVGHLFQGRFKSKPVETDGYLIAVVRYIHLNPVQAAMCSSPADYRFSSYRVYAKTDRSEPPWGLSTDLVSPLITPLRCRDLHLDEGRSLYELGMLREERGLSDEAAIDIVEKACGLAPRDIGKLGRHERDALIRRIVESGMPRNQLARIGGMAKRTISGACDAGAGGMGGSPRPR